MRDGKIQDFIFVEGVRLVKECLRSSIEIVEVFCEEDFAQDERRESLVRHLKSLDIDVFEVSNSILNSVADTKNAQGIVLIAKRPQTGQLKFEASLNQKHSNPSLVVLLSEINNPNNLGAIFRSAEAANVSGIIITTKSADAFSPKSLRASMGSAFRIPLWQNATFSEALDWAREQGLVSVCGDIGAAQIYSEFDWKTPVIVVFGSEAHGLTADERDLVDHHVKIPMANEVESLNLAVSCGIILFESRRQNLKSQS